MWRFQLAVFVGICIPIAAQGAVITFFNPTSVELSARNILSPGSQDTETIGIGGFPGTGTMSVDAGAPGNGTQSYRFDDNYQVSDALFQLDFDFAHGSTRADEVGTDLIMRFTVDQDTTYRFDGMLSVNSSGSSNPSSSGFGVDFREDGSQIFVFGEAATQPIGTVMITDSNAQFGSRSGNLIAGKDYLLFYDASSTSFGQSSIVDGNFTLTISAVPESSTATGLCFLLAIAAMWMRWRNRAGKLARGTSLHV